MTSWQVHDITFELTQPRQRASWGASRRACCNSRAGGALRERAGSDVRPRRDAGVALWSVRSLNV